MGDLAPPARFVWTYPTTPPPAHLVVDVSGLTLTRGELVQRVSLADFNAGALHDTIVEAFDFPSLIEALALALPSSQALLEHGVPSAKLDRPQVPRVHGGGRGAAWVVFLLGRKVSGRAHGQPFELSFEELLANGLPPEMAVVIGSDTVAAITRGVRSRCSNPVFPAGTAASAFAG